MVNLGEDDMKEFYNKKIHNEYLRKILDIKKWEKENKEKEVFKFYEDILYYFFYEENEFYKIQVKNKLYSFLSNVIVFDTKIGFVISLQNFLSNIIEDHHFVITQFRDNKDSQTFPWVGYNNDYGYQDIIMLEEALQDIIDKMKKI